MPVMDWSNRTKVGMSRQDRRQMMKEAWAEFCTQYPTEESCLEALQKNFSDPALWMCQHCHSTNIESIKGARVGRCLQCRKPYWFTSGTFFHKIKKIRPWMGAIWLFENGYISSAFAYSQLAQVAQSTAQRIFKSLFWTLNSQCDPSDFVTESGNFLPLFNKRSLATARWKHPSTEEVDAINDEVQKKHGSSHEQEYEQYRDQKMEEKLADGGSQEFEHNNPDQELEHNNPDQELEHNSSNQDRDTTLKQKQDLNQETQNRDEYIYQAIATLKIPTTEQLCLLTGLSAPEVSATLTLLELDNRIYRLPGDRFQTIESARADDQSKSRLGQNERRASSSTAQSGLEDFITFVAEIHQGCSHKYLMLYTALQHVRLGIRQDSQPIKLLDLCLQQAPIRLQDLLNFITPLRLPFLQKEEFIQTLPI
ncbi:MAG: hypothetical protein HY986_20625 [Candidatus Melainabacteria bacterium]|nr:hypothetical protein [Candidatus Melainabacteria bacterium]